MKRTRLLLLFLMVMVETVFARQAGFGTWALLTSRDVQDTGLSDLLTAELTRGTNTVWLERDALKKVIQEQELSQLSGANGTAERLALGQLLSADALLIVAGFSEGATPVVRMVMVDCHSGARLDVKEYPASASAKDKCKWIAHQFETLHARFPNGVERIVALPPFRSRNLVYDYDGLQTRYADLLAQTLAREPGLAVLALEEVRAIAAEKNMKGERHASVPPLFVEGEFRMTREAKGTGVVAEVTVRITSATSSKKIESGSKPLSQIPGWLITDVATKVLSKSGDSQGVTVEKQVGALVGQADAFERLGDYAHAAPLRESAIMLSGDTCEQRLRVLENYHHLLQESLGLPPEEFRPDSKRLHAAAMQRVEIYQVGLDHLEYLIRNALINADQAITLASRWTTDNFSYGLPGMVLQHKGCRWKVGQEELAEAETAEERFMTQTYLQVRTLRGGEADQPERRRLDFLNRWVLPLWKAAQTRKQRSFYSTKEDLDFFQRVVTQLVPDGLEVRNQALPELQPRKDLRGPDAATPEEFAAFWEALASSTNRMVSIQGRYALYNEKFLALRKDPAALAQLRPDVERLYADFKAYGKEAALRNGDAGTFMLIRVRDLLTNVSPTTSGPSYHYPAPSVRTNKETYTGALRISPMTNLTVQLRQGKLDSWFDKKSFSYIREWVSCSNRLDVLWGERTVLFLGTGHTLDAVIWESATPISDVVWDGAHVWVAMPSKGLLKFDTAGRQVGAVGVEQGLPPSEVGLKLHPLGADRLVAIGSFGPDRRAWCARVEWKEQAASQISVFHEATIVPRRDEEILDARQVFSPYWLHAYQAKGDKADPFLLVGRAANSTGGQCYPLKINLRTFEVSVFDCKLAYARAVDDKAYFSRDGLLLEGWQRARLHIPASVRSQGDPSSRPVPLSNPAPVNKKTGHLDSVEKVTQVGGEESNSSVVLANDGWVYVPGRWWYRIDPRTWTGQRLTSYTLPSRFSGDWSLWNSTRFGLVGQCNNRLYQISIDEKAIPEAGSVMDH
jgi:hypothetical protein